MRFLKIGAKLSISFLIFFVLFEFFLRFGYQKLPNIKYFLYSSRYDTPFEKIKNESDIKKYSPCPMTPESVINKFAVNGNGFYTAEYKKEKEADIFRIGFIGDSFLIGVVPHEYNFVTLVAKFFEARRFEQAKEEREFEIVNWGLPCIGPQFEEKIFEIEALPSKPDYLVWNFFVGNDFTDELFPGEELPLANKLAKNIYTLRLLRNGQRYLKGNFQNREMKITGEYDPERPTFSESQYLMMQSEKLRLFDKNLFPNFQWGKIKDIFISFSKKCAENGIKCLVVIIPDENQVNKELLRQTAAYAKIDFSKLAVDYPQKLLTEFFTENKIDYLDLLPFFAAQSANLYQPRDTHWNLAGNQLATRALVDYLLNRLSLGKKQSAVDFIFLPW